MSVKPITPAEVTHAHNKIIPPEVVDVFNDLITKHWNGNYAEVAQKDAVDAITAKMKLDCRTTVFDNHWLDVEDLYRSVGWKVLYDARDYTEDGVAYFRFIKGPTVPSPYHAE